ncbi:MAG TPA: GerMN domain-containing protein [Thermodesulfobacteriota bacterium]|nr:GerMN domain-containing protein [Thermodesulfobacteriota bacterium]
MKRRAQKKGQKKSRKKGGAGKALFFLVLIGLSLFLAYQFRKEIVKSLEPFLKKTPEKRLARRAEKEQEKKTPQREWKTVTLYFSEEKEEYLTGEKREILNKGSTQEEAKEIIQELIKGPKGKLIRTLPPRTKLLSLEIDEKGVARVNFDKTLSRDHPGGSSAEMMTVYSVVNSLVLNFPQIKGVQFLIEGEKGGSITGHLALDHPILSKADLIKK